MNTDLYSWVTHRNTVSRGQVFIFVLCVGKCVLESALIIWAEVTPLVQPTSPRVSVGNKNAMRASVFMHVDQALQDACPVSSLLEGSGELKAVQGDGFSNTTACAV